MVSLFKGYGAGYRGLIPPYVVLTELQGRFSEAGFLPSKCKPFATGGDPAQSRFVVEGIVAQGVTDAAAARPPRVCSISWIPSATSLQERPGRSRPWRNREDEAYELILGDGGETVRSLAGKRRSAGPLRPQHVRAVVPDGPAAGRARRPLRHDQLSGLGHAQAELSRPCGRKLPEMDKAMATLLQDLSDRKLLDSTIVWWSGEFGRTPKVQWEAPWNGGRGHWGQVFSAVLAGGGFKGGHVVGSSDAKGEQVKDRPVYPCDLIGSMYELLGIPPTRSCPIPKVCRFA